MTTITLFYRNATNMRQLVLFVCLLLGMCCALSNWQTELILIGWGWRITAVVKYAVQVLSLLMTMHILAWETKADIPQLQTHLLSLRPEDRCVETHGRCDIYCHLPGERCWLLSQRQGYFTGGMYEGLYSYSYPTDTWEYNPATNLWYPGQVFRTQEACGME